MNAEHSATIREALSIGKTYAQVSLVFLNHCRDRGYSIEMLEDIEVVEQRVALFDAAFAVLDAQSASMPQPDWSKAPEWAEWWCVEPSGEYVWCEAEPTYCHHDHMGMWMVDMRKRFCNDLDAACLRIYVTIPIDIDWRTLKQRRPIIQG